MAGGATNARPAFLMIAALAAPIAAISLAQDSILGERHSGTAAWVLSKPLRRPAFILAKLVAHGLGLLVAWVVLPGALAYLQLRPSMGRAVGRRFRRRHGVGLPQPALLPDPRADAGHAVQRPGALCWGSRSWWTCTGLMQFIALPVQKYAPWLGSIMPWRLMIDFGNAGPLAGYLAMGQPLPTFVPIVATALWCAVFVGRCDLALSPGRVLAEHDRESREIQDEAQCLSPEDLQCLAGIGGVCTATCTHAYIAACTDAYVTA